MAALRQRCCQKIKAAYLSSCCNRRTRISQRRNLRHHNLNDRMEYDRSPFKSCYQHIHSIPYYKTHSHCIENNQKIGRPCMIGRPYSILKEDQLFYIIRKFQEVLIETVKIRFKRFISFLNSRKPKLFGIQYWSWTMSPSVTP